VRRGRTRAAGVRVPPGRCSEQKPAKAQVQARRRRGVLPVAPAVVESAELQVQVPARGKPGRWGPALVQRLAWRRRCGRRGASRLPW
jgi:hypothetical protein